MTFANNTHFSAQLLPSVDPEGQEVVVAMVKASYSIDSTGKPRRLQQQITVRPADEPWDPEDPLSSVRLPGDLCDAKVGTDVVVVGDAIAPRPVEVLDVAVQVGQTLAPLRVHGPRLFSRGAMGMKIGRSVPFERQAIRYEAAYGGASADWSEVELRNPSGVGVAKHPGDLDGQAAPQIEHPARPHLSASDRHPPMGYGPIATHWSPRKDYFGTVDELWQTTRCPIFPRDFDRRYHSVAHPSLWFERALEPGTRIGIVGMSASGTLSFELPCVRVHFAGYYLQGRVDSEPHFDTLVVYPNEAQFELTMRASFPLRRHNRLREIRADVVKEGP